VTILRQEKGLLKSYHVNLKKELDGKEEQQFFLKPDDIVYIREKFNWFRRRGLFEPSPDYRRRRPPQS